MSVTRLSFLIICLLFTSISATDSTDSDTAEIAALAKEIEGFEKQKNKQQELIEVKYTPKDSSKKTMLKFLKKLKKNDRRDEKLFIKIRIADIANASEENTKKLARLLIRKKDKVIEFLDILHIIEITGNEYYGQTIEEFLDVKKRNPDEWFYRHIDRALIALGTINAPNSFDILISYLENEEIGACAHYGSIRGLMWLNDKRAIKHLIRYLDSEEKVDCHYDNPLPVSLKIDLISYHASLAIDEITGKDFKGNKKLIQEWLEKNGSF